MASETTDPDSRRQRRATAQDQREAQLDYLESIMRMLPEMAARLEAIERAVGQLRITVPRSTVPLTQQQVEQAMAVNGQQDFEVLEAYRHMGQIMKPGRVIRGSHYTNLVDHVRAGLKLAAVTVKG